MEELKMRKKSVSTGIVVTLVVLSVLGIFSFESEVVHGTDVSGDVYDGSGGPFTLAESPYIVTGHLTVPSGRTLTIEPGVEVRFNGRYQMDIYGFLSAIGTPLSPIQITSNSATPGNWEGIYVNTNGQVDIQYCIIEYGAHAIRMYSTTSNNIENSIIRYTSSHGIFMDSTTINTLSGNTFTNSGIYILGSSVEHWNSHHIDLSNTVDGKPVLYFKDMVGGMGLAQAGQIILANCTGFTVENQDINHGSVAVQLGFSSNNEIINNQISENLYGIVLLYSDDNLIRGNTIFNHGYSITIWYSSNNIVEDNRLYTDTPTDYQWGGGIHLFQSSDIFISGCSISRTGEGIYIQNSEFVSVMENEIDSNKGEGVRLWVSNEVDIIDNEIWDCGLGIRMFQFSTNVVVYHNQIINNNIQAIDGSSNVWDDGYPSGGNYWSDYTGSDEFSGPNQDIPGSDGIGDTPYVIDGDSEDRYPLMESGGTSSNSTFLHKGWNLISIPYIQPDTNLEVVLSSLSGHYKTVSWHDGQKESNPWRRDHVNKPSVLNDLNAIDHTMGFWILITKDDGMTFEYPGSPPVVNQEINIYEGWNMVGYPSPSEQIREDGLNNLQFGTDIDAVQWYDASTNQWHFLGPTDYFEPGRGYWIHSNVDTMWNVSV
jgi:parallel beta-helix repeat protein